MKQRNLNLVFLWPRLVVPFEENVVAAEQFDDGSSKVARLGAHPVTGVEVSHATERNALRPSPKKSEVGL